MAHLLEILASTSAWIHKITPQSSMVPCHSFSTPVSPRMYVSFVYQILSLLHWLQHRFEGYSAGTAQMNTWKGSCACNITLSTTNLAAASWYNRLSWIYMCPFGGYTTYRDSYFFSINNELSMTPCNSAVTHWVLCHALTSNARDFTYKYDVERRHMQGIIA